MIKFKEGFKSILSKSSEVFSRNKSAVIAGIALGVFGSLELPYAHGDVIKLVDLMTAGLIGMSTWQTPVQHGISEIFTNPEFAHQMGVGLMNEMFLGFFGGSIYKFGSNILSQQRDERGRLGIEPLKKIEKPSHIIIGPTSITSDLAQSLVKINGKPPKNQPIVSIHSPSTHPPAVWGSDIKYHFMFDDVNQITGQFPPVTKPISFIEATGMDRADEITFVCLNPDNSLYYGESAKSMIPPNDVSSIIKAIPEKMLKGKKIHVVFNKETELGGTVTIQAELERLAKKYKFILDIRTPEELFINNIKTKLTEIAKTKKEGESINITVTGQGGSGKNETDDDKMLVQLRHALKDIGSIEGFSVNVALSTRKYVSSFDELHDVELPNGFDKIKSKNQEIYNNSDLIIPYGNTDQGTSTIVRSLLEAYNVPVSLIYAVVEKSMADYDFIGDVASTFNVYQEIIKAMSVL